MFRSFNAATFSDNFARILKGMAERAMADVVKERRKQDNFRPLCIKVTTLFTLNDFHELASIMINAYGVRETAVRGARKNKLANAELLDAP